MLPAQGAHGKGRSGRRASLSARRSPIIPDYAEKQSNLIFDFQNNVKMYPAIQHYLREYQPKLLAIWRKNGPSFIWAGAEAFGKDVPVAKLFQVDSGNFALESCCKEVAENIRSFF